MQRGRAFRIHHRERLKKKRASYYGGWAGSSPHRLGMVVTTPTLCSCWMCGNPRKYFGQRTRQEIIAGEVE